MSALDSPSTTPQVQHSPQVSSVEGKPTTTDKPAKKRTKKKTKRPSRKPTLKTKVIIRRLPPNLPETIFLNSVQPWTSEQTIDYSLYVPGKLSKSKAKESVFSRAYFHFKTMEAVVAFHQGFDGHVFVDKNGVESRAVVEFAPYQKMPKEHKTKDTREGTIDEDADYLAFLESLKAEEKSASEAAEEPADGLSQIERLENRIAMVTAQTLAAEQANKPKTTPLIEHLRAQKAAQAAVRAKALAKKQQSKKKNEKVPTAIKKNEQQHSSQPQQQQQPQSQANIEGKKKRDRHRKKKDADGAKKTAANGDNASVSSAASTSTTKSRPPREPKSNSKPKEPRPAKERTPRPPKEGSKEGVNGTNTNPKLKKSTKKPAKTEGGEDKPKQAPVTKILGRQTPAANTSG